VSFALAYTLDIADKALNIGGNKAELIYKRTAR